MHSTIPPFLVASWRKSEPRVIIMCLKLGESSTILKSLFFPVSLYFSMLVSSMNHLSYNTCNKPFDLPTKSSFFQLLLLCQWHYLYIQLVRLTLFFSFWLYSLCSQQVHCQYGTADFCQNFFCPHDNTIMARCFSLNLTGVIKHFSCGTQIIYSFDHV